MSGRGWGLFAILFGAAGLYWTFDGSDNVRAATCFILTFVSCGFADVLKQLQETDQ